MCAIQSSNAASMSAVPGPAGRAGLARFGTAASASGIGSPVPLSLVLGDAFMGILCIPLASSAAFPPREAFCCQSGTIPSLARLTPQFLLPPNLIMMLVFCFGHLHPMHLWMPPRVYSSCLLICARLPFMSPATPAKCNRSSPTFGPFLYPAKPVSMPKSMPCPLLSLHCPARHASCIA